MSQLPAGLDPLIHKAKTVAPSEMKPLEMPDWQKRLLDEYEDLSIKVSRLDEFMSFSDEYKKLSGLEKELLKKQNEAMTEYMLYLSYRLDFYKITRY